MAPCWKDIQCTAGNDRDRPYSGKPIEDTTALKAPLYFSGPPLANYRSICLAPSQISTSTPPGLETVLMASSVSWIFCRSACCCRR